MQTVKKVVKELSKVCASGSGRDPSGFIVAGGVASWSAKGSELVIWCS